MTKYLTLDIETRDDYIGLGLGAGWVYKLNYDTDKYNVIGVAVLTHDGLSKYITDFSELNDIIVSHDVIIGHNLSYDLGGLYTLGLLDLVVDKPIIDTYVMAKLFDSSMMLYDLDILAKKYLNKSKNNQNLVDAVIQADIYPWLKREIKERDKCIKNDIEYVRTPDQKKLLKWCKSNMTLIQEQCYPTMVDYAIQDVRVTKELFNYFQCNDLYDDINKIAEYYSFVIHVTNDIRMDGICVDLNATRKAIDDLQPILNGMYQEVYDISGVEFNVDSPKQMQEVFDKLKINYLVTEKGNPSFPSKWMKNQSHPICKMITKIRSYRLVLNTFIKKTLKMQEDILGLTEDEVSQLDYGVIYPQMNVLRAKTGRFSSSDPNIQQIPKRDPVLGPLCRSMFVPWAGQQWYSLDYSNQEGRIHLHYAFMLECEGAQEYVEEFINNPKFDTHKKVAELCNTSRDNAKTIYLGKSYGMGDGKTCSSLGLPTNMWTPDGSDIQIEVAGPEGRSIIDKFNEMLPYLKKLSDKCTESLKSKQYIITIGGRKLRPEVIIENKKFVSMYYRALSLISQGSGADQIINAMILAYRAGIKITCVIHDEINICAEHKGVAVKLRDCMNNAVTLCVPQNIDIGCGDSWQDAK